MTLRRSIHFFDNSIFYGAERVWVQIPTLCATNLIIFPSLDVLCSRFMYVCGASCDTEFNPNAWKKIRSSQFFHIPCFCQQVLGLNVTKRLLNVHNPLSVEVCIYYILIQRCVNKWIILSLLSINHSHDIDRICVFQKIPIGMPG